MSETVWFLFLFMFEPCCDMSITRFDSQAQCQSVLEEFSRFSNTISKPNPKGFSVSCFEAKP